MPCLGCETNHYCGMHGLCLLALAEDVRREEEGMNDHQQVDKNEPNQIARVRDASTQHDHPCGVCTKLGSCSCQYPAVSYDFTCDPCQAKQEQWGDVVMGLNLTSADVDTFQCVLLILERDQTHRSMAARLRQVLDRAVKP